VDAASYLNLCLPQSKPTKLRAGSDFFSSLNLLFECPIKIGDRVEIAGCVGEVREIAARATRTHNNYQLQPCILLGIADLKW
jgi:Mechanosensitive ion channel